MKMKIDSRYVGIGFWAANRASDLNNAIKLYNATQSEQAALNVIAIGSEIVAISIISGLATSLLDKKGLDNVFDSMMKESIPSEILDRYTIAEHENNIKAKKLAVGFAVAFGLEKLLQLINDYIAKTGALNPLFDFISELMEFGDWLGGKIFDIVQYFNDQDPAAAFQNAETLRFDPIVLDLDGDGIETLSQDAGIHFDLDNNGMAETTGWVSGDDGLLVQDINGNGTIDSGAELFDKNHPWFLPSGRTKCVQNRSRRFCGNHTLLNSKPASNQNYRLAA